MRAILIFCCIVISTSLTGCSIADRVSYEDGEGRISEQVFSEIDNGKTQKQWVVNQLGEPFAQAYGPDNSELFTYRMTRAHTKHASLLLFLRYNGVERDVEYFHVVFDNNIVKKHWHDKFPVVQGFTPLAEKMEEPETPVVSEKINQQNDPILIDGNFL